MFAWHIPDGFIAAVSDGGDSHESVCVTNDTDVSASLTFTAFFSDRPPLRREGIVVDAQRNRHLRTDAVELMDLGLRREEPYGLRIESAVPLHLQYSRLDQSAAHSTLMTTVLIRTDSDTGGTTA